MVALEALLVEYGGMSPEEIAKFLKGMTDSQKGNIVDLIDKAYEEGYDNGRTWD